MKWVPVVILVIIGALAAFVAVEYLTVSIHHLPSYIPGHKKGKGHYHARGAVAALISFVLFVIAGYLIYRNVRATRTIVADGAPVVPAGGTADSMLSEPRADEQA